MSRKRNKNEKRTELAKVIFILPHRKNVFSAQAQCVLLCQRVCVLVCVPVLCCAILIIVPPCLAPLRLPALLYIYFRFIVMSSKKIAQPELPSPLSSLLVACLALLPLCLWSFWGFCATHTHLVCSLRLRPVRTWTSLLRFVLVQASTRAASLPELTGHGLRLSCAHCTGLYGSAIPSSPATWPY